MTGPMTPSTVPQIGRIDSIQLLRGLAATLVAAFHLWAAAGQAGYNNAFFNLFKHGEAGVDIFFVISGFIIVYSVDARGGMTPSQFAKARFWRILPPYWTILSLYLLLATALAVLRPETAEIPSGFSMIVSYLLVPYPDHIIPIAWTLSLELAFYAVFALTYLRFGKGPFVAAMVIWVVASQIFSYAFLHHSEWLVIVLHTAVAEFLFGALIAFAFARGATPLQMPALALGVILLVLYLGDFLAIGLPREIMPGVPAMMIVYGVLGLRRRLPDLVILWGEASYILYLAHLLIFAIVGNAVRILFDVDVYRSTGAMIGMLVAVIVLSCLATKFAEQPYQRWYKNRN